MPATAPTAGAAGGPPATASGSPSSSRTPPTASRTAAASSPGGNGRTTGTATSTPSASSTRSRISPKGATYGQTVDQAEAAPPAAVRPGPLPARREDRPVTGSGVFEQPFPGAVSGTWVMRHSGDPLTLTGRGYVRVAWDLSLGSGTGVLQLPVWTGLRGRLFHVASGGGHRMDDVRGTIAGRPITWMGSPATGYDLLPAGAQQMWQNEYYYLDGTVTLHNLQGKADYHLGVAPTTRTAIGADLAAAPFSGTGRVRYGIVRDTGTDAAPVPQYLTRKTPTAAADLAAVPQRSAVS